MNKKCPQAYHRNIKTESEIVGFAVQSHSQILANCYISIRVNKMFSCLTPAELLPLEEG